MIFTNDIYLGKSVSFAKHGPGTNFLAKLS
jgi:hypothetical protein